jgi:hypothetical protein
VREENSHFETVKVGEEIPILKSGAQKIAKSSCQEADDEPR